MPSFCLQSILKKQKNKNNNNNIKNNNNNKKLFKKKNLRGQRYSKAYNQHLVGNSDGIHFFFIQTSQQIGKMKMSYEQFY